MLDWLFHLLNHPWTPWSGACLIAALGTLQWLIWHYRLIGPARRRAAEELHRVERDARAWSVLDQPHASALDDRILRASLTLEDRLGQDWEAYHLHTVPTLLLGAGLLFTLLGLTATLFFLARELQTHNLAEARQALDGLLLAASLKFLSSISGLCTAFLFSWAVRRQRDRLAQQLGLLAQWLDERPPPSPQTRHALPAPTWEVAVEVVEEMPAVHEEIPEVVAASPSARPLPPPPAPQTAEDVPPTEEVRQAATLDLPAPRPPVLEPPRTQPPAAATAPAPTERGPVFAQLAGEFLARPHRRKQPPVPATRQTP
ncbi:MAG: hypothetical protein H7837_03605 [Magnetococcus sp. MYC-9]